MLKLRLSSFTLPACCKGRATTYRKRCYRIGYMYVSVKHPCNASGVISKMGNARVIGLVSKENVSYVNVQIQTTSVVYILKMLSDWQGTYNILHIKQRVLNILSKVHATLSMCQSYKSHTFACKG